MFFKETEQKWQFGDVFGARLTRQPLENRSEQANQSFSPFQIAAEPEQVVGDPAGQIAGTPEFAYRLQAAHQTEMLNRLIRENPDIFTLLTLRHSAEQRRQIIGGYGEATWHYDESMAGGAEKDPQDKRLEYNPATVPGGHHRGMNRLFGKPDGWIGSDGGCGVTSGVQMGLNRAMQMQSVEIGQHMLAISLKAAPPAGMIGKKKLLTAQHPAEFWQENLQGWSIDKTAAERIGNIDGVFPSRLDEPGDAGNGIPAERKGVAILIVNVAEDRINWLEPGEFFQKDLAITHGEILAFHQLQAEIAGKKRVFKVDGAL